MNDGYYYTSQRHKNAIHQRLDNLRRVLSALKPAKAAQRIAMFNLVFKDIVVQISRQVPLQDILFELNSAGMNLTMSEFKAMLNAERKLRNKYDEKISCASCGAILQLPFVSEFHSTLNCPEQINETDVVQLNVTPI